MVKEDILLEKDMRECWDASVDYNKKLSLELDKESFDNKTLIPCERCWSEKPNALKALQRVVHWRKKGYEINDITYLSLLGVVGKNNNKNS